MDLPRLVIGGTQSGVGKTTITLGIMAALKRRGMVIAPYKVGPDYIDPGFHNFVTGNKSRNLDLWLLSEKKINYLFQKNSRNADISIVEGVMGLFDGKGIDSEASTAHLAKVLKAPVILVIDGSGVSTSAAAQVMGYQQYDWDLDLAGVVINRVSGQHHYRLLKEAIERDTGVRCLGYLKRQDNLRLKSRQLGLVPGIEVPELEKKIDELIDLIEESVDLEGLLEIAGGTSNLSEVVQLSELIALEERVKNINSKVRIGVAYDKAFNFYYQDNLDLLEGLGAELVYFSPLEDTSLPQDIDGLYIGGGFPEEFGEELEGNIQMRKELARASQSRLPIYAECGGLLYLTESLTDKVGDTYQMVGLIPTASTMTDRLQRFGYVEVELEDNLFNLKGTILPAHEFHYSRLVDDSHLGYSYRIKRKTREWECGVNHNNLLAGYPHLHFYSKPELAYQYIKRCYQYRKRK